MAYMGAGPNRAAFHAARQWRWNRARQNTTAGHVGSSG